MANRPSVQEFVTRWQSGTQTSGAKYTSGVQNSGDWAANALNAAPARNAGIQRAIANGDIDAGIQRVGTAGWRQKTLAKGPDAWLRGVTNATPQMTTGAQKLYQMLDMAQNEISSLPRGGLEDNLARMTAHARAMNAAKQQLK